MSCLPSIITYVVRLSDDRGRRGSCTHFQIWLDAYYPNIHTSKYVLVVYSLRCVGEPHDDLQHIHPWHGTEICCCRGCYCFVTALLIVIQTVRTYIPCSDFYPSTSSHLRPVPALVLSEADTLVPLIRVCSPVIMSCLLYTSPSPRDQRGSRMPSSA